MNSFLLISASLRMILRLSLFFIYLAFLTNASVTVTAGWHNILKDNFVSRVMQHLTTHVNFEFPHWHDIANIGTLLTSKSFIIIFDNVTITSTAKGINIGSVLLWSLGITGNKIAISKLKRGTSKQKHWRAQYRITIAAKVARLSLLMLWVSTLEQYWHW